MSQTPEERTKFQKDLMPSFKVKKAIYEVTHHEASKIVLNKVEMKVYFLDGSELRLVCKSISSGYTEWEEDIGEIIRATYVSFMFLV